MICPQCGALIEDSAKTCENCGMILPVAEAEVSFEPVNLPAPVPDAGEREEHLPKKDGNLFVKWVSIVCSVICFVTFMLAAATVETAGVSSQMPSMFGSIFGGGQATLSPELAGALGYAFTGMAFAFSGLILIAGFKKK